MQGHGFLVAHALRGAAREPRDIRHRAQEMAEIRGPVDGQVFHALAELRFLVLTLRQWFKSARVEAATCVLSVPERLKEGPSECNLRTPD
eukprot:7934887-Alexandrium_andersonii.AAC.1